MQSALNQANPCRFQSLPTLDDIDDHAISFAEAGEPRSFNSRDVDEYVLSAAIASDEAETLFRVEPFDCAGFLHGHVGGWPVRCRRPEARLPWCDRSSGE